MELLIGCGNARIKKLSVPGRETWRDLVTLDISAKSGADMLWDLNKLPLPFKDNSMEEIHAYDVLEHCGRLGDWQFFFDQFADFHRILTNGGLFFGTVPDCGTHNTWGDPGHTRSFSLISFVFLSQQQYSEQVGHTSMTDYREYYKADFDIRHLCQSPMGIEFILKARKGA
jgi:hypothetical protein